MDAARASRRSQNRNRNSELPVPPTEIGSRSKTTRRPPIMPAIVLRLLFMRLTSLNGDTEGRRLVAHVLHLSLELLQP